MVQPSLLKGEAVLFFEVEEVNKTFSHVFS